MAKQTSQRRHRLVRLLPKMHAQQFLNRINRHAPAHHQSAIRLAYHVGRQRLSVVATLPDNFFNQVFHSGDSRHRTMFINNHGQRMPLLPHFSQQVRSNLGFRHEQNRFHQLPYFSFQQILIRNL